MVILDEASWLYEARRLVLFQFTLSDYNITLANVFGISILLVKDRLTAGLGRGLCMKGLLK